MTGLPVLLDISGRLVVVVGGGAVATRRVATLLDAGAVVRVVAPAVSDEIDRGRASVERRRFVPSDLDGTWLVVACTDDPSVNARIAEVAATTRTFCIRADAAAGGTARVPAVLRRGDLVVAVNGGDDPRRAGALRDAIGLALDTGALVARRHRSSIGSVALVGGGPGDPELITVRGRRLVAEADVIVVDRLAPRALLEILPPDVEIVDCGKSAHRHNLTQAQINDVLLERARAGLRVVRLKGGDPFVFGRGGEEYLACLDAGVDVEVVPGLSSAIAGPAAAGIPLTHRGVAADFMVVSGHLDPDGATLAAGGHDWSYLATGPSTLVLLMAMDRLAAIATELVARGRSAETPTAVIQHATLPAQRVVRARLDRIAAEVERLGVGAPAVVVIGPVVDVLPEAGVEVRSGDLTATGTETVAKDEDAR